MKCSMFPQALAHFECQVQTRKIRIGIFKELDHSHALTVVIEAAVVAHAFSQHLFARMSKGRESPDFSANGARTARSPASISSRVLQKTVRRGVSSSEECLVTIDSQPYLSILAFETSNLICPRKLAVKNPPKDGFAVANKSRLNV